MKVPKKRVKKTLHSQISNLNSILTPSRIVSESRLLGEPSAKGRIYL